MKLNRYKFSDMYEEWTKNQPLPLTLSLVDTSVIPATPAELHNLYTDIVHRIQSELSSDAIADMVLRKFGEFSFYSYKENTYDAILQFRYDWSVIAKSQTSQIIHIMRSLYADYNPLENYDIYEDGATGNTQSSGRGYVFNADTVSTNSDTTYDDTDLKEVSKTATAYTGTSIETDFGKTTSKTLTKLDNNIDTPFTDMDGSTHKDDDKNYSNTSKTATHRHGNAGVMTVPDMVLKEFDLRFKAVLLDYVDTFAKGLLVLVETGD